MWSSPLRLYNTSSNPYHLYWSGRCFPFSYFCVYFCIGEQRKKAKRETESIKLIAIGCFYRQLDCDYSGGEIRQRKLVPRRRCETRHALRCAKLKITTYDVIMLMKSIQLSVELAFRATMWKPISKYSNEMSHGIIPDPAENKSLDIIVGLIEILMSRMVWHVFTKRRRRIFDNIAERCCYFLLWFFCKRYGYSQSHLGVVV